MADNKTIGRNANTYDLPDAPLGIELNTATYTKILDAKIDRIGYKVSNLSQNTILIVEKIPNDNQDRGFPLFGRAVYESKTDNVPIGEIHAKALTGTPSILVTDE